MNRRNFLRSIAGTVCAIASAKGISDHLGPKKPGMPEKYFAGIDPARGLGQTVYVLKSAKEGPAIRIFGHDQFGNKIEDVVKLVIPKNA